MKILKKILNITAWILIIGGIGAGAAVYMVNRSALALALKEPAVQASLKILTQILLCAAGVFAGLIVLSLSLRVGAGIRTKEKERAALEKERAETEKMKQETEAAHE